MRWGNYGAMGWGWAIGAIFVILLVATAVVRTVRTTAKSRRTSAGPSPKEILDERLAKGELTPDQYQVRLKALG